MLRNYLITAWRNILKGRSFSLINVLGLALGMAVCLLVLQYVGFQLSYDSFHSKADRIYRIGYNYINTEGLSQWARTGPGLIRLKDDFPEVEEVVRLIQDKNSLLTYEASSGEKTRFQEERNIFFADAVLFQVFDFHLVKGNPAVVLRDIDKMLISESAAQKWFGEDDPIGRRLHINDRGSFEIEGVFEDIPSNSHVHFDYLLPYPFFVAKLAPEAEQYMTYRGTCVYVLLKEGSSANVFLDKINTRFYDYFANLVGKWEWSGSFFLQKLREIHTDDDLWGDVSPRQDVKKLYALALIGFLILFMALINYINLATIRSVERSKEVGVRKSVGAARRQLIWQFMLEAMLMSALAFLLAMGLVALTQDHFSQLSGWVPASELWQQPTFWFTLLFSFLAISLISGLYPAFVLTAFRPIKALKSGYQSAAGGKNLRRILSVVQYAASVCLLIGTIIIFAQIRFLQEQDLGFNMDQVFVVRVPEFAEKVNDDTHQAFQQRVLSIPAVSDFTYSYLIPGDAGASFKNLYRKNDPDKVWVGLDAVGGVDYNYLDYYGIKLKAGRFFDPAQPTDSTAFVLSEVAIKRLGYVSSEEALGELLMIDNSLSGDHDFLEGRIIGVIEDFQIVAPNMRQMEVYQHGNSGYCLTLGQHLFPDRKPRYYSLKVDMSNWSQTEASIKEALQEIYPDGLYDSFFQDELYNQQYQADIQFLNIFVFFALQAVFIACLGLFGLAAFQVQKRSKEIGIRKALGATIADIWLLLAKDLFKALLIASLIGIPLINYFMKSWLEEFVYKIPLSWWMFALPVALMILIALLTVSQHLRKAARLNPVKLLRYE